MLASRVRLGCDILILCDIVCAMDSSRDVHLFHGDKQSQNRGLRVNWAPLRVTQCCCGNRTILCGFHFWNIIYRITMVY